MTVGTQAAGAEAQAERIAARLFLGSRGGQLLFSSLMVASDRQQYSHPRLQIGTLVALAAESAWLGRRVLAAGRYDDRLGSWVDALSAAAAVIVTQRGLGAASTAPWAKNFAIGAAGGSAGARRTSDAVGTVGTLCFSAMAAGMRAAGRDAPVAGWSLAVNDAVNWAGCHVAARVYVNAHRRYARLRDEADAAAVARAAATETEAERSRQQELLHQVTIDVLGRIAASPDLTSATALAGTEAARLRFALRTGGRVPEGLDEALAVVTQEASAAGMRVELVAGELTRDPGPAATAALRAAVQAVLLLVRELGGTNRAVVRATESPDAVTVTVRDHGAGFEPGGGSDYESRLLVLQGLLDVAHGTLALSSETGNGVRVTMKVPPALSPDGSDTNDALQRVPDGRYRLGPTRDDHEPFGDRHVDPAIVSSGVERSQHDVNVHRLTKVDPCSPRDPLEARAQQRLLGGNASRGISVHLSRVTALARFGMGRTTQFAELPAADTRRADGTLLSFLLAWRLTGLATGAASLAAGRTYYRSRSGAVGQLMLASAESAWYARRVSRQDRWSDPEAGVIDAASAAAVLLMGQLNLRPVHRSTWINWAPWTLGANAICGQAMGVSQLSGALCGAAAIVAVYGLQPEREADVLANSAALATFFAVTRLFAFQIRDSAVRLDRARAGALREGAALARARERSVQLRLLHDHALQTLETVANGRFADLASVRTQARAEAIKLDREVNRAASRALPLVDRLSRIAAEHSQRGVPVHVSCPQGIDLTGTMADALCGAANEALTNVRKHARARSAEVRVSAAGHRVIVTISDDGVGFDQPAAEGGFGMSESIERRMRDAGGASVVESAPGAGTRVTLSGPA